MATAFKDKSIGSIIKIKYDDIVTDFILTNIGAPDSSYRNANGAWLTRKNIINNQAFNSSNNIPVFFFSLRTIDQVMK